MAKVSINTDITPIPKRIEITYDQIKQLEVNTDTDEKMKDIIRRESFALFKTLYTEFYLYNMWDNTLYQIADEYYVYLLDIGCCTNVCANRDHVLQIINNAITNNKWHAIAGTKKN